MLDTAKLQAKAKVLAAKIESTAVALEQMKGAHGLIAALIAESSVDDAKRAADEKGARETATAEAAAEQAECEFAESLELTPEAGPA